MFHGSCSKDLPFCNGSSGSNSTSTSSSSNSFFILGNKNLKLTIYITLKLQLNNATAKLELFTSRLNQSKQIYCFLEEFGELEVNLFL